MDGRRTGLGAATDAGNVCIPITILILPASVRPSLIVWLNQSLLLADQADFDRWMSLAFHEVHPVEVVLTIDG